MRCLVASETAAATPGERGLLRGSAFLWIRGVGRGRQTSQCIRPRFQNNGSESLGGGDPEPRIQAPAASDVPQGRGGHLAWM